jgi:CMP-N,N'-diacetyllegionaminic acid synthase
VNVLGIITARGGSKGIPRKNVAPLLGKPLLAYTAECAHAAGRLTRVILSTDDAEIAAVGISLGLAVPFMRPAELALSETPTLPVLQHALRFCQQQGEQYDAVCLLQPTHPLRSPDMVDGCIDLLATTGADSVVTMLPVPHQYNPHWVYFSAGPGLFRLSTGEAAPIPRRQELPAAYHREGSVYVTRSAVLLDQNSMYGVRTAGFLVDPAASVNIDEPTDFARAELLMRRRNEAAAVAAQ